MELNESLVQDNHSPLSEVKDLEDGNLLVSVFKSPVSNVVPLKDVGIEDLYQAIKSTQYKEITDRIRACSTKEQINKIKTSELDYVCFAGTFTKRANYAINQRSGYFCIDVDNIEDVENTKNTILQHYQPVLMFVSPSGNGLKVIYKTSVTEGNHAEYFRAIDQFFTSSLGLSIDKQCKDISRACFLCYDPDCFISSEATVLDKSFLDSYPPTQIKNNDDTEGIIDYHDVINKLKEWLDKKESFVPGNRNHYILQLAGALNRFGVPESFTTSELTKYSEEGFTEKEIIATVRSIYSKVEWHGTAKFDPYIPYQFNESPKCEELKNDTIPLLPINGFSDFVQSLINECSKVYGTHRDFWAGALISATSLAIGNTYKISTGKYYNTPVVWLSLIAPTGVGKTEPGNIFFEPFHKIDNEALRDFEAKMIEWEHLKTMNKKQRQSDGIHEIPERPICKSFILSDTTPEAVIHAHKCNKRGISIVRDELTGWILDFGRYQKSGEVQNWISAWSQQPMTVHRKGNDPEKIIKPFINVYGTLQPDVLPELAKDYRDVNGFMQRFCWVYPDHTERPSYNNAVFSDDIKNDYNNYIRRLLALPANDETILLSPDAKPLYEEFYNHNKELINDEKVDYLRGVYAKQDIIALRLALIIHFSNWACTGHEEKYITPETMQSAIDISNYFRMTGKKVFIQLQQGKRIGLNKKTVIKFLYSLGASQNEIAAAIKVKQPYVSRIINS